MHESGNRIIGVLLALVVGTASGAAAATWYVAPDGDDGAAGTREAPWRSPAYGASRLGPGDTLVLLPGTYVLSDYETDILRPPSGAASAWVTIRGETGGRAVLAGRDDLAMAVELGGRSWVRLENLEITHDPGASGEACRFRDGISIVDGPAAHIVLQDLVIHHVDQFGLDAADVDDLQVLDTRIEYCGFGAIGGPAGTAGGLRNVLVRGCSLSWSGHYYQGGDGSDRPYDRPDGFGIEASSGPVVIEDTTAEHNFGDGLDSKADGTLIRRCVVANNSCDGVKLWGGGSRVENTLIYGRGDGDPEVTPWAAIVIGTTEAGAAFELVNVTVDDALGNNYLLYAQYDDPVPIELTIRNCIFSGRGPGCPIWLRDTVTLSLDHALFWFPRSSTVLVHGEMQYEAGDLPALGPGIVSGDPLFQAPAWGSEGDYHLESGSPAIDAGTAAGAPVEDLDGTARDGLPDLGAYEYRPGGGGCTVDCNPTVPATAAAGEAVSFHAGLQTDGCAGEPAVHWEFGDGATSNEAEAVHTYGTPGQYRWTLAVTQGAATCTAEGEITIAADGGSCRYLVPAVAHNPGAAGTLWRTDLAVLVPGAVGARIRLDFAGPPGALSREIDLDGGELRVWRNVLESLFGLSPESTAQGAVQITAAVPLVAAARTFNRTPDGSFGQFVPALTAGDGITAPETGWLALASGTDGARTNLGLAGLSDSEVEIRLHGASGDPIGSTMVRRVSAGGWIQVNDLFAAAGVEPREDAYVTVHVVEGEVWAYLSVIDGATGDAVTVPAVVARSHPEKRVGRD